MSNKTHGNFISTRPSAAAKRRPRGGGWKRVTGGGRNPGSPAIALRTAPAARSSRRRGL